MRDPLPFSVHDILWSSANTDDRWSEAESTWPPELNSVRICRISCHVCVFVTQSVTFDTRIKGQARAEDTFNRRLSLMRITIFGMLERSRFRVGGVVHSPTSHDAGQVGAFNGRRPAVCEVNRCVR
ncbi:hypothetical protein PoB_000334200 [Plakobranchus ocellatus]|uniref:Uncharacterized protein n=1 Tax=Plakobranchus ocellatus TaxID=259542 RepID=A0AAV3Y432_9GAST|nr:hypothetical protein PoB_000334200 [Plakobranchus ocellatus]